MAFERLARWMKRGEKSPSYRSQPAVSPPKLQQDSLTQAKQRYEALLATQNSKRAKRKLAQSDHGNALKKAYEREKVSHLAFLLKKQEEMNGNGKAVALFSFLEKEQRWLQTVETAKRHDSSKESVARTVVSWYHDRSSVTRSVISGAAVTAAVAVLPVAIPTVAGSSVLGAGVYVGVRIGRGIAAATGGDIGKRLWGKAMRRFSGSTPDTQREREILDLQSRVKNHLEHSQSLETTIGAISHAYDDIQKRYEKQKKRYVWGERCAIAVGVFATAGATGVIFDSLWGGGGFHQGQRPQTTVIPKAPPFEETPRAPIPEPHTIDEVPISGRGPEGAVSDYFHENVDVAIKFGWDGSVDLSEWAEKKAHVLWLDDAQEALAAEKTIDTLKEGRFSSDLKGYSRMMKKIAEGTVEIDQKTQSITTKITRLVFQRT
ncbi:MAG TPA: hypothetical protein VJH96_04115 [Patescibacteria group bacterium]|nr:hypothetical protein [Patescibacteria group bacterium]